MLILHRVYNCLNSCLNCLYLRVSNHRYLHHPRMKMHLFRGFTAPLQALLRVSHFLCSSACSFLQKTKFLGTTTDVAAFSLTTASTFTGPFTKAHGPLAQALTFQPTLFFFIEDTLLSLLEVRMPFCLEKRMESNQKAHIGRYELFMGRVRRPPRLPSRMALLLPDSF